MASVDVASLVGQKLAWRNPTNCRLCSRNGTLHEPAFPPAASGFSLILEPLLCTVLHGNALCPEPPCREGSGLLPLG